MKKYFITGFVFLFISSSAIAAESKLLSIDGTIKSFDSTTVQIKTSKGVLSVPRKFIPAKVNLKFEDPIKIPLTEEQLKEIK